MKDVGISVFVKKNFYYKYNHFVKQYNSKTNRIDEKYMKNLECLIFTTLPCCYCYPLWILFSIGIISSVPAFIYNLLRFITLIKIISTLKENKRNFPDPFQKMIYCKTLHGKNKYYRFTTKVYSNEIQQLGINIDCFNYVTRRIDESLMILGFELMFYNDTFVNYYTKAPKAVCFDMCITTTLLILSAFFSLWAIMLFIFFSTL